MSEHRAISRAVDHDVKSLSEIAGLTFSDLLSIGDRRSKSSESAKLLYESASENSKRALPDLTISENNNFEGAREKGVANFASQLPDLIVLPDGSIRHDYPNGTGWLQKTDANGAVRTSHWGPLAEDKYQMVEYANGSIRVNYADGRGTAVNFDEHDNVIVKSWGPTATSNFDGIVYRNGDVRYVYANGSGYALNQDGNGNYEVKHWGPTQGYNYKEERVFKSVGASQQFVRELGRAYLELPESERRQLDPVKQINGADRPKETFCDGRFEITRFDGVEIKLPKRTDSLGGKRGPRVPTFNDSRTHDNQVGGAFHSDESMFFVSEEVLDLNDNPRKISLAEYRATFKHEVGHALDYLSGWISSSPEFKKAYDADLKSLPLESQSRFRYFTHGRRNEVFAEAYAGLRGDPFDSQVTTAFPRSTEFVRKYMSRFNEDYPAEAIVKEALSRRVLGRNTN